MRNWLLGKKPEKLTSFCFALLVFCFVLFFSLGGTYFQLRCGIPSSLPSGCSTTGLPSSCTKSLYLHQKNTQRFPLLLVAYYRTIAQRGGGGHSDPCRLRVPSARYSTSSPTPPSPAPAVGPADRPSPSSRDKAGRFPRGCPRRSGHGEAARGSASTHPTARPAPARSRCPARR